MAKTVSGQQTIAILCRFFGFFFVSQKGSHVKLAKKVGGRKIVTIVPLHKELAYGTLRPALDLAEVEGAKFRERL